MYLAEFEQVSAKTQFDKYIEMRFYCQTLIDAQNPLPNF